MKSRERPSPRLVPRRPSPKFGRGWRASGEPGEGLFWGRGAILIWALLALLPLPLAAHSADIAYTSTREVISLAALSDGTLWVQTTGGVLRRSPNGTWEKWARAADAPLPPSLPPERGPSSDVLCRATWQGKDVTATVNGLEIGHKTIPLPTGSPGTHISALLAYGHDLWAALYGDGLWDWDGRTWRRLPPVVPPAAREMTALASGSDGTLWLGTRRAGVWEHTTQGWRQCLWPGEPSANDAESLMSYKDQVVVGTLEDGLAMKTSQGWQHITAPTLSSDAPRQMAVFRGALYVRHGGGQVDRLDGTAWTRNVCATLPRKQVSALAADARALYAAQWGGWSEWDGTRWTSHLRLPDLQGVPITALCPNGPTLWIGTQGRGVLAFNQDTGQIRSLRDGLPDDWVTCLAYIGNALYAGTFVGGLARWDGARWVTAPEMAGGNITALEPDGAGGLFIATRQGVWHQGQDGVCGPLDKQHPILDLEAQCLCVSSDGLWVGTRTELYRLSP